MAYLYRHLTIQDLSTPKYLLALSLLISLDSLFLTKENMSWIYLLLGFEVDKSSNILIKTLNATKYIEPDI